MKAAQRKFAFRTFSSRIVRLSCRRHNEYATTAPAVRQFVNRIFCSLCYPFPVGLIQKDHLALYPRGKVHLPRRATHARGADNLTTCKALRSAA